MHLRSLSYKKEDVLSVTDSLSSVYSFNACEQSRLNKFLWNWKTHWKFVSNQSFICYVRVLRSLLQMQEFVLVLSKIWLLIGYSVISTIWRHSLYESYTQYMQLKTIRSNSVIFNCYAQSKVAFFPYPRQLSHFGKQAN